MHQDRDPRDPRDLAPYRKPVSGRACIGAGPTAVAVLLTALALALSAGDRPACGREKPAAPEAGAAIDAPATNGEQSANPLPRPGPSDPPKAYWSYAREMFTRGDYVAAAEVLEQAYARDPRPVLLFNVGQAYRKASRYAEAIDAYERFLKVAPKQPIALDAADYIRTLRLLLAQEARQKQIELAMEQTQEELARVRRLPIYKRAWFWATLIGASATIVAIGVGVKVYNDQRATDTGNLTLQF